MPTFYITFIVSNYNPFSLDNQCSFQDNTNILFLNKIYSTFVFIAYVYNLKTIVKIDVCEAVKDMIDESRLEGKMQTLVELVKDGTLSITKAAAKANMTVKEFEKQMDK